MARIYPRSSLSLQLIFVGGGVVDADYRGNVKVILTNLSDRAKKIEGGDRIAQVLFVKRKRLNSKKFVNLMRLREFVKARNLQENKKNWLKL